MISERGSRVATSDPGAGASPGRLGAFLRQDKATLLSFAFLVFLIGAAMFGGPIASRIVGHGPDRYFAYGASVNLKPVGPWTWIPDQSSPTPPPTEHTKKTLLVLGGDGPLGRDEFLRLLYGARTTIVIALGATFFACFLGVLIGCLGFFSGAADVVGSRGSELVAAFPFLLLVTAIGWTIGARLNAVRLGFLPQGVISLIVIIGAFTWPYPARIVRSRILVLRESEFVEAARMVGSGPWRIFRVHVLPHVMATLLVYLSLIFAANVVLEAALSVLNLGLQANTPDWGTMLSQNWGTLIYNQANHFGEENQQLTETSFWTQALPAGAIFFTVVALCFVSEALRRLTNPTDATAS